MLFLIFKRGKMKAETSALLSTLAEAGRHVSRESMYFFAKKETNELKKLQNIGRINVVR